MDRILVIDAGNSNTVFGFFHGSTFQKWRVLSRPREIQALASRLPKKCDLVVISSVVPRLNTVFKNSTKILSSRPALFLTAKNVKPFLKIKTKGAVGIDRLINVAAAYEKWQRGLIVIDIGTAMTLDVVSPNGEFLGGVIAPGMGLLRDVLFERCEKLPKVSLKKPRHAVGKNTVGAMQSGIFWGIIGMIEGLLVQMQKELKFRPYVVATGGWSTLLASCTRKIHAVDPDLTLKGLRLVSRRQ